MKIACISDIHGNKFALDAVLADLPDDIENLLFLGDLCGYYPFLEECTQLLKKKIAVGIRGNHDQVLIDCLASESFPNTEYEREYGSALRRSMVGLSLSSKDWIQDLPLTRTISLNGLTLTLYHGAPWNILDGRVYPDFDEWHLFEDEIGDIILLGQTHYPIKKIIKNKLIVNPGSVGQPRDQSNGASYSIIDLDKFSVKQNLVSYNSSELIADAKLHDPNIPYLREVLTRQ